MIDVDASLPEVVFAALPGASTVMRQTIEVDKSR